MVPTNDNEPANKPENTRKLTPEMEARKWQPGQSGNPSGRPKKKWLTEVAEELLEEKLGDPAFREAFKEAQWRKLLDKGVVSAMTLDKIWERMEGKVKDEVDMHIKGDIGEILEAIRSRKHGK